MGGSFWCIIGGYETTKGHTMTHIVKDGVRSLEFNGDLIAESSSKSRGKPRWVEFKLYRTESDIYVISRVGVSNLYHTESCSVVTRNRLSAVDESDISSEYTPCRDCRPVLITPDGVYPETPRSWAQVCQTAKGVIASLMKEDHNGTEYLTNVARRLLDEASVYDDEIKKAYLVEFID